MERTITINNLQYKTVPEIKKGNCTGCAFYLKDECKTPAFDNCLTDRTIWILDTQHKNEGLVLGEPKYTVEEVLKAVATTWDFASSNLEEVTRETSKVLKLKNDPNYATYLELKKVYEPD